MITEISIENGFGPPLFKNLVTGPPLSKIRNRLSQSSTDNGVLKNY